MWFSEEQQWDTDPPPWPWNKERSQTVLSENVIEERSTIVIRMIANLPLTGVIKELEKYPWAEESIVGTALTLHPVILGLSPGTT